MLRQQQFAIYLHGLRSITIDNNNSQQIIDEILSKHLEFQQQLVRDILTLIGNLTYLGPISLINPNYLSENKANENLLKLRHGYEVLLGAHESPQVQQLKQREYPGFIENYVVKLEQLVNDHTYQQYVQEQLNKESMQLLTNEQWQHMLGEVIDIPTIQEILQTQIEHNEHVGSDNNSQQKCMLNYDGDEERTPIMSEQEITDRQVKQQHCKKKVEKPEQDEVQVEGDEDGYEASNSDHSKVKSTKTPKNLRRRKQNQNPSTEFDTDRERSKKQ